MAPKAKAHSAAQAASKKKSSVFEVPPQLEQRIRQVLQVRAGARGPGMQRRLGTHP
jgi:hypothetical protein